MCRASVQGEPLFDDGDQDLDRDGDPDLGLRRILGRPEEAFDRQMPINPFEEKIRLSSGFCRARRWLRPAARTCW
jgi:hypothetical protein